MSVNGTLTYKSRPAGQQVTGSTYVTAADEAGLTAIKDAAAPFLKAHAISKINVEDARTDGDNSAVAGCKEARVNILCDDGTLAFAHIPFLRADVTEADLKAMLVNNVRAAGGFYTNKNGSKFVSFTKCQFVNHVP